MKLNIYNTPAETIEKLADYIADVSRESIEKHGRFSIALSGGGSPQKLYKLLASDSYKTKIDWHKVFFFFGDERFVPLTHKDSNYLMAKQAFLQPLNIADAQIFPVNTSLSAEEAAREYEAALNDFFGGEEIEIDLVLLGLGVNSHTASLFPYTNILHDKEPAVKAEFIEEVNMYRITLNAPLINNAKHIAFLVFGKDKAEAVHHILKDKQDIVQYPAQLIKPVNGDLQWFMDEDAAGKVK